MTIADKVKSLGNPIQCFPVEAAVYEHLASAVRPDHRFTWRDVDERHVIIVNDAWTPQWVWYVPEAKS